MFPSTPGTKTFSFPTALKQKNLSKLNQAWSTTFTLHLYQTERGPPEGDAEVEKTDTQRE